MKGSKEAGQSLVALLAFMVMAVTLTSAATIVTVVNATTSSKFSLGEEALTVAEAGVDNAMLRLVRDSSYSGETLTVGSGTATITVSGSGTKTITSVGLVGTFRRTVVATATIASTVLTLTSWVESP